MMETSQFEQQAKVVATADEVGEFASVGNHPHSLKSEDNFDLLTDPNDEARVFRALKLLQQSKGISGPKDFLQNPNELLLLPRDQRSNRTKLDLAELGGTSAGRGGRSSSGRARGGRGRGGARRARGLPDGRSGGGGVVDASDGATAMESDEIALDGHTGTR